MQDENSREIQAEVVPGLDLSLEKQRESDFKREVAALDAPAREALAGILSGRAGAPGAAAGDDGGSELTLREIREISRRGQGQAGVGAGDVMRKALTIAGVTPQRLAGALVEGLNARKPVIVAGRVRKYPDYAVRIRYLELAHRLRGDLSADKDTGNDVLTYEERIRTITQRKAPA